MGRAALGGFTMCIFCKIVAGEIPASIEYQDDNFIVIKDIAPSAPVHLLIIPKKHLANIMEIDHELAGGLFTKIATIAKQFGLEENGFRLVINTGKEGGQTVEHLHIHLLGGRALAWPAG